VSAIKTIYQIDVHPSAYPVVHAHHVEVAGADEIAGNLAFREMALDVGDGVKRFFLC
jgi:hypothetical protein